MVVIHHTGTVNHHEDAVSHHVGAEVKPRSSGRAAGTLTTGQSLQPHGSVALRTMHIGAVVEKSYS